MERGVDRYVDDRGDMALRDKLEEGDIGDTEIDKERGVDRCVGGRGDMA